MSKAFSIASWNVEHFRDDPSRIRTVIEFLRQQKADVFALYEVEGREVFSAMVEAFPGYQFHITEGEQVQEILVGVKSGFTAFFSQRLEFQYGQVKLRPGALLTISLADVHYSLLFLHNKSSADPIGLGLRDVQIEKAYRLKKVLDKEARKTAGRAANFLVLGDLNTMGLRYIQNQGVQADLEITKLEKDGQKAGMRLLGKNSPASWWNGSKGGYAPSNLDHVLASGHLSFKKIRGAEVDVRGWVSLPPGPAQDDWIAAYSDHSLLYLEVQRV